MAWAYGLGPREVKEGAELYVALPETLRAIIDAEIERCDKRSMDDCYIAVRALAVLCRDIEESLRRQV